MQVKLTPSVSIQLADCLKVELAECVLPEDAGGCLTFPTTLQEN